MGWLHETDEKIFVMHHPVPNCASVALVALAWEWVGECDEEFRIVNNPTGNWITVHSLRSLQVCHGNWWDPNPYSRRLGSLRYNSWWIFFLWDVRRVMSPSLCYELCNPWSPFLFWYLDCGEILAWWQLIWYWLASKKSYSFIGSSLVS